MSTNKDPRRLPVYIDRVNNRLLADPQTGGPWFVVGISGGGSVGPGSLVEAGILQLEDSTSSTSTSKAATPNSVRQAFSLADIANSAAQGAAANATTALSNSQAAVSTANAVSGTANTALSTANAAVATANAAAATANSATSAVSGKLDLTGGTITGDVIFSHTGRIGFEGSTDDVFETYLAVVNPTADRTITLPNATGTVALLETANTWSSAQVFQGIISFSSASCANQLYIDHSGSIAFEGSSADDFETFLYATNPTADRSIYLPNASGTIALSEGLATVATTGAYGDLSGRPTLGTSASLNVAAAGNAAAGEVVKGNDTRLTTNISYTANTRALASSTGTGATLPLVADAAAGLAPASGGGTSNYLRADGSWAVPPGAALTDGDRGDITVSSSGTTWTIDNGVVSYAKMQTVSTGNRLLGKAGATPGPVEEIPCSQAGRDIIGASDPATQRTFLGLGSLAQLDALGNISSTGTIGALAGRPIITTTGGVLTAGIFGSSASTFCEGNDARLSDTRLTPNALTLASNGTGSAPGSTFNGSSSRTISYNSVGAAAETHTHGNISSSGAIGTTSGLPIVTGTNGILQVGAFGSTIGTFCQGNDARLSDTRNTPNALTFDNSGTGAASGSTFNGSAARTISFNTIGAAASGHTHGQITNAGAIGTTSGKPIITGAGGVLAAGSFGTSATTFCEGNDSRLSNTRNTTNSITLSNAGNGAGSGTTFNGSTGVTISYNSIGAQAALGFTPIQQGGGTGQFPNKLYIGWDNSSRLRLQIDVTNYGGTWPIDVSGNAATVTNGVYTTGNQTIAGNKTFTGNTVISQANLSIKGTDGVLELEDTNGTTDNKRWTFRTPPGELVFQAITDAGVGGGNLFKMTRSAEQIQAFIGSSAGFSWLTADNSLARLTLASSAGSGTATHADFVRSSTTVGSITTTTTATAYNTSSDYRLKENIRPLEGSVTRLKQLKPSNFNFIAEPDQLVDGFLAHELQEVVPAAVAGDKDAVDNDGTPIYQGVDLSKIVPLLTAALQEVTQRLEALEAAVQAGSPG